jgi:hypothetical protein
MPDQPSLIPIILIDSSKARKLDVSIALQKIYYQPSGYQRTIKQLYNASNNLGYDFTFDEVRDWLERQAVHQIHKPRPKYIPRVGFNTITIPNDVHQADVLYMPYDKVGRVTYLFCLNVVDVASRYKVSIPIGAISVKDRQGILTSKTIARCLEKIYNDPKCPLVWPNEFLSDKGPEFKGACERLLKEHGVKIRKAKSKRTMGIVERYNSTLTKRFFRIQDAHDLLALHLSARSRAWVKNRPIIVKDINNSITSLIGITPVEAIKKKMVNARPSWPARRPTGYNEDKLTYDILIRYLLEPSDLEGNRRRAGDMNWSQQIYRIRKALIQKDQPILYWLIDDNGKSPERSFVNEELLIIPDDTELPPQWVLTPLGHFKGVKL